MKHILMIGAMTAAFALPATAEEEDTPTLMEQGAELFFEGLRREMEPALDELLGLADQFGPAMQSFMQEMGPALAELASEVKDWSVYEMPEILPNGDIIIRKKQTEDAPEIPESLPEAPDGATDI
ncbi:hypothetical protein J7394_16410 [Ruegeria sp. R13_0]|uniref:hypothetical protein n=1 Tax=Ruegeria sp. R13_0 TaxID=2821099 RepID=UPI001AD9A598|nr:hypothetical protein [Ruegeria sp. R13_0]MBO9435806.1 hypothetical protein [Ruegeria sp. R13_0]